MADFFFLLFIYFSLPLCLVIYNMIYETQKKKKRHALSARWWTLTKLSLFGCHLGLSEGRTCVGMLCLSNTLKMKGAAVWYCTWWCGQHLKVYLLYKRTAALMMCCSLLIEPTLITSPAGHLDVTVGESIVLPCQVSHDPTLDLKFTWFFNEQLIHFGSHWSYFEKVGGVSALTPLDFPCHCISRADLKLRCAAA